MTEEQKKQIDKIVIELHDKRHKFWNYFKANVPRAQWDDLFAEVVCALYKNPESTCKAISKNQHVFLATRIVLNMWASNSSPYYKKFRTHGAVDGGEDDQMDMSDGGDLEYKEDIHMKSWLIDEALRHLPLTFYEDQLIRLYFHERIHVRDIATQQSLSVNTVYANIIKVVEKLQRGIAHYLQHDEWDVPPKTDLPPRKRRAIYWYEPDGVLRQQFANSEEAAAAIGITVGNIYGKAPTERRFRDGSYISYRGPQQ